LPAIAAARQDRPVEPCTSCRFVDSRDRPDDSQALDPIDPEDRAARLPTTAPPRTRARLDAPSSTPNNRGMTTCAPFLSVGLTLLLGVGGIKPLVADEVGKTYGAGVTLKRAVPIATLLTTPQAHAGKAVRVDGVVRQVCQSMGCWVEIADPALGRGLRFKARDGVIVFPKEAVGHKISAEGTFEEIATSPEREAHAAHARAPENSGKPVPASPTEKIYWVRVSGAVLY
jgi:hypothetical protein